MLTLRSLILIFIIFAAGCSSTARQAQTIYFVPGVAGDGLWYNDLRSGIRDGGVSREIVTFSWGAIGPFAGLNFSNKGVHDDAEQKLAKVLFDHHKQFPGGRIDLIGHSAGCGVILGALARLPEKSPVNRVILLAPSVSPEYDLAPALAQCSQIDAFVSDQDKTFLSWRTSNFGTYDRVKTKAAGHLGFITDKLSLELSSRLIQHRYQPTDKNLGNDGGHFGATARKFVAQVIGPLLR